MGDIGDYWREAKDCAAEAAERRECQRNWFDDGAHAARSGRPIDDAEAFGLKKRRQWWRRGWRSVREITQHGGE